MPQAGQCFFFVRAMLVDPSSQWSFKSSDPTTGAVNRDNRCFCPLARDVEVPFAWDAFEFVDSMVVESEAGSDDEILHGRGDKDL